MLPLPLSSFGKADIVELFKVIFDISKLFVQCSTDSCCGHITGGVNIYLYGCISLLVAVCAVCICLRA